MSREVGEAIKHIPDKMRIPQDGVRRIVEWWESVGRYEQA
jgi:hypothetical protein